MKNSNKTTFYAYYRICKRKKKDSNSELMAKESLEKQQNPQQYKVSVNRYSHTPIKNDEIEEAGRNKKIIKRR